MGTETVGKEVGEGETSQESLLRKGFFLYWVFLFAHFLLLQRGTAFFLCNLIFLASVATLLSTVHNDMREGDHN